MPDYFNMETGIFNWQFGEKWRERQEGFLEPEPIVAFAYKSPNARLA